MDVAFDIEKPKVDYRVDAATKQDAGINATNSTVNVTQSDSKKIGSFFVWMLVLFFTSLTIAGFWHMDVNIRSQTSELKSSFTCIEQKMQDNASKISTINEKLKSTSKMLQDVFDQVMLVERRVTSNSNNLARYELKLVDEIEAVRKESKESTTWILKDKITGQIREARRIGVVTQIQEEDIQRMFKYYVKIGGNELDDRIDDFKRDIEYGIIKRVKEFTQHNSNAYQDAIESTNASIK